MQCPFCGSSEICSLKQLTVLGYPKFRCRGCGRRFNERTGTIFNYLEFPSDVVLLVVRWRLRYKLSLRDLAEMFLERGLQFTHEAVRDWEARLAPLITDVLRRKRGGLIEPSWYVDETYVKVKGVWRYWYRAIDRDGNLVDCRLSERRDMAAARAFFREAREVTEMTPDRATTDGHAYPGAIAKELGEDVLPRTNRYLNNLIEQGHRGIKQRYRPMRGFGAFDSAKRFCRAHDEVRNFYRPSRKRGHIVSLADRRSIFREKN
jgi:transposase-like protein